VLLLLLVAVAEAAVVAVDVVVAVLLLLLRLVARAVKLPLLEACRPFPVELQVLLLPVLVAVDAEVPRTPVLNQPWPGC